MKTRNRNSGQSLVEFALIFPLIFLLITGFLDVSRAIFAFASVSNAVREGARYATVNKVDLNAAYDSPTDNAIIDKVISYSVGVNLTKSQVTVVIQKDTDGYYTNISITATHMFIPVTPGIKRIFGTKTGIPITAQSTMRIAQASR
jgi:Flp pilus assembly protein TadG